tara:strand:+ start:1307 stop:2812 length:1506 start_codon:yes stop_codon:yes gene_type:complete
MYDLDNIKTELNELIINSVKNRVEEIGDNKIGVLFSGGIDSTMIAFVLKSLGVNFTCYAVGLDEAGLKPAEDLVWAQKVAKELGFQLKIIKLNLDESETIIKKTAKILGDIKNKVVHVGVGGVIVAVCEHAKQDGVKFLFSGLGSEEIFAGYQRHEQAQNINKECKQGIKNMEKCDLLRDNLISDSENVKFLVPFLDKDLVKYALDVPSELKIKDGVKKYILRLVAEDLGMPKDIAFRKKKAAQYGSNFDKAIMKLAKKNGFQFKMNYLNNNIKLGALVSGGKDSIFAMYKMIRKGYDVKCLITVKSKNLSSYMFHTPNIELVKHQSKALGIPVIIGETKGEKEKELIDLKKVIRNAKEKFELDGIITGALFSTYQRERIEKICDELKLKCFSPLWHTDQEKLLRDLVDEKFEIIITAVAGEGLGETELGEEINNKFIDKMVTLNKKNGINVAFEGGEAETLVVDCPIFKNKLVIENAEKVMENECTGKYIIKDIELVDKQ